VFNQDQRFAALYVAQPITPLFKVRQAVRIARADEQIAQVQLEKARRELRAGVEQLYFGLLAAQRIRGQALLALEAANKLAQATGTVEARLGALQALQGVQAAGKEVATVSEQLNSLLDLPLCTMLELVEPAPLVAPVHCAEEAVELALTASPEVAEARQNIVKAEAAVRLGKLAYVPDVVVMGFSAAQDAVPAIQKGFSGVSVVGTVSLFEGGKRRQVVLQRKTQLAMAQQNLRVVEDKVRLEAQKTYREFGAAGEGVATAKEVLALRREAVKSAQGPAAQKAAVEELMKAEIESIKAELGQRQAYSQLLRALGKE
jgi:outer membrane protein TolC